MISPTTTPLTFSVLVQSKWKTKLYTQVNEIKTTKDMGKASKSGTTALNTKVTGSTIKLVEKVDLFMLMEMSIKAIGLKIKPMDRVSISIMMELLILENGRTINSMEKVCKLGLMERVMMDNIK